MKNKLYHWKYFLNLQKKILLNILLHVSKERKKNIIYPPKQDVFNAFYYTPFHSIKVVIIGQDPYHQPMQAHGLAFSVRPGSLIPPSLKNIYQEIIHDLHKSPKYYYNGYLKHWAKQGVLLLNSMLTVQCGRPGSHKFLRWEDFTDSIISYINKYLHGVVFLLWGKHANRKHSLINDNKHFVFSTSHPSPFSAHLGFLGCRHFSKTNKILLQQKRQPITW